MKNLLIISLLLVLRLNGFGQDTLVIKTTNENYKRGSNKYEEFTVSLSDSTKNGYYKMYSEYGEILKEGIYTNGKRNGIWKYYEQNVQAAPVGIFNWNTFKEEPTANKGKIFDLINQVIISIIADKTEDYKSIKDEKVYLLFILSPSGELKIDKYGSFQDGTSKENISKENQVLFDEILKSFPVLQFISTSDFNIPISLPIQLIKN